MPKCRPSLDDVGYRSSAEPNAPVDDRSAVGSGIVTAEYWSRRYDAAISGVDSGKQVFDRHAALLEDSRLSGCANKIQRAMIVRKLQRDYGTGYVQQLIERMSRRRATQVHGTSTASPPWDKHEYEAGEGLE